MKTQYIYADIEKDAVSRFDTSNYELDRPFVEGTNKKVIGLTKHELAEKIIRVCCIESKNT